MWRCSVLFFFLFLTAERMTWNFKKNKKWEINLSITFFPKKFLTYFFFFMSSLLKKKILKMILKCLTLPIMFDLSTQVPFQLPFNSFGSIFEQSLLKRIIRKSRGGGHFVVAKSWSPYKSFNYIYIKEVISYSVSNCKITKQLLNWKFYNLLANLIT